MDFNLLVGCALLAMNAIQLKLDHFNGTAGRQGENDSDNLNTLRKLGEAIEALEDALTETVSFIGQTNERNPNTKLAELWNEASQKVRRIKEGADLAHLTFEKGLYWANPDRYRNNEEKKLHRISIENVLNQLKQLRATYDDLQKRIP